MKYRIIGILVALLAVSHALAQSVPNGGTIAQGQVWSVPQWMAAWQAKADVTNGTLTNPVVTGGTLNNVTINSATFSGTQTPFPGTLNLTQGFTYGWGNTAVGLSIVTNSSQVAQVMGTFGTVGVIGSYPERDSVGLYFDNTAPAFVTSAAGTFTSTTFVPTTPFAGPVVAKFQQHMIVDTNDATKFSGQLTGWAANGTSITVDAWVQAGQPACGTNPGIGAGCVAGTPSGTAVNINPVTKAFAANGVCLIRSFSYATACAGIEIDILDSSSNAATNITWGYDANNLTASAARDAYIARGLWDYGFQANTTGIAAFYVPVTSGATAGFLHSRNAGTGFQTNGNPGVSFNATAQTTGNVFNVSAVLVSGNYINFPFLKQSYLGQLDLGSETATSASPLVFHSSGNAGGDASISAIGGTGLSDGGLVLNAGSIKINPGNITGVVGADPTGVSDSATAINTAITNLAATGGNLVLSAGTYKAATSIIEASNVVLYGYGATLNYTGSGYAIANAATGTTLNCGVIGLTIQLGASGGALNPNSSYQCQYRNIHIKGTNGTTNVAILLNENTSGTVNPAGAYQTAFNIFDNVEIDQTVGTGIRFTGTSSSNVATDNTFVHFTMLGGSYVYGIEFQQWADSNTFVGDTNLVNTNIPSTASGIGVGFGTTGPGVYSETFQMLAITNYSGPSTDNRQGITANGPNTVKAINIEALEYGPVAGLGVYPNIANLASGSIMLAPAVGTNNEILNLPGTSLVVGGNVSVASVQVSVLTVSTLPTCNSGAKGTLFAVSDATAPTYNATLTGGSTVYTLALCNGSAWVAH